MQINFAGATGSFTTLSIADLLNGDLPGERFRDRIVLIRATAPSMGDSRLAPFTHYGNDLTQGGREMPGVEIHANIINTIRAGLYFRPLSDQVSFLLALLVMVTGSRHRLLARWLAAACPAWTAAAGNGRRKLFCL
jgi:CHASE2 domain-containing sensor protein